MDENILGQDTPLDVEPQEPMQQAIGAEQLKKARATLEKYKQGKQKLESKIVSNEEWWKLRHWQYIDAEDTKNEPKPASAWLFNCIISKHADYMDAFPKPNILPREIADEEEAKRLSSIIPVVLRQNEFEQVYSDESLYKLKNGVGVYGVFWDSNKLNGLGDINIQYMDILSLYWQPGVTDIQKSRNFFSVELVDNDLLKEQYPQTIDHLSKESASEIKKYNYDDTVDTTDKSLVIDWYYKKNVGGKNTVQYCKFVNDVVLYATENETVRPTKTEVVPVLDELGQPTYDDNGTPITQMVEKEVGASIAEKGLYEHGLYPFVFDVLFKEEGTPIGLGFVDICKNPQMSIDLINNAFEKNTMMVANPRYMFREDGGINEEEFANPFNVLVHVDGNLGEDSIRPIETNLINSNYIGILENKIQELKETAGNRDAVTGGTTSGVTAASAIAAMQESAGKTSRDQIKTTYRAYRQVINMVIELIREFYAMPRQFRIIGDTGAAEFVTYDNSNLQAQYQGNDFGTDMGYRLPVFDIDVEAEKESPYSQLSQNELALQFYNAGFFNPELTDQALTALDMMQFQGKDKIMQKIQANGGMYQQLLIMQQQLLQMSEVVDGLSGGTTNMAEQTAGEIMGNPVATEPQGNVVKMPTDTKKENAVVSNARKQANDATQPR